MIILFSCRFLKHSYKKKEIIVHHIDDFTYEFTNNDYVKYFTFDTNNKYYMKSTVDRFRLQFVLNGNLFPESI